MNIFYFFYGFNCYLCLARELLSLKLLLQCGCSHTCGLSPECVLRCTVKAERYLIKLDHYASDFIGFECYLNEAFTTAFFSTFERPIDPLETRINFIKFTLPFIGMNTRVSNEIRSSTKSLFAIFESTFKWSFKIR